MKKTFYTILGACASIILLGLAGRSDKQDAVLCEMKNNGAYWELAEKYPQASDARLVEIYERERAGTRR